MTHLRFRATHSLAAALGVPPEWVLLTNSGTAALAIAYHMLAKDRMVEAPAMTWPATYVCAPRYTLVDSERRFYGMHELFSSEPGHVRVHVPLWGAESWTDADVQKYSELGPVIIDAAHLFGSVRHRAWLEKGHVQAVTYSFGPQKEITTWRGGALISPHLTDEVRAFANVGTSGRDLVAPAGGNYLMSEPAMAVLCAQLGRFCTMQDWRMNILAVYESRLSMLTQTDYPRPAGGHLAVAEFQSPAAAQAAAHLLSKADIMTGHHYPLPPIYPRALFPKAATISSRIITLPCHLDMGPEDAHHVCDVLEPFDLAAARDA